MAFLQSLFLISINILIYVILFGYFWSKHHKEYILANWGEYRCNPMIMPFANSINPNVSTSKNFEFCIHQLEKLFFDILSTPFKNMLNVIKGILETIVNAFNSIRNLVNIIRTRIESVINNLMSRFQNMEDEMRFFIIKLKDMLGKVNGIMRLTEYTFLVLSYALQWVFEIPGLIALIVIIVLIGLLGLFMFFAPELVGIVIALSLMIAGIGTACFDKYTLIKLEDGSFIPIYKLKVGDRILGGGKILSCMTFLANKNNMFNYLGQIVSGDHLVFEEKYGWIRVSKSIYSKKIKNYQPKLIYCLNTEHNKIITKGNIIFSDFNEVNDINFNSDLNNLIKQIINNKFNLYYQIPVENKYLESQLTGFYCKTVIKTIYGEKSIDKIKIGDILINNQKVTGIVKSSSKNVKLFNYCGVIASGSNLVYENNNWIRIYQSKYAKSTKLKPKYIYQLSITSNQLIIKNIKFLDLHETNNLLVNRLCDYACRSFKNNNSLLKKKSM